MWASLGTQWWRIRLPVQGTQVRYLGQEDPRRRKWQPTSVSLPRKSHGQRSLEEYSPCSCKMVRHGLAAKTTKPMSNLICTKMVITPLCSLLRFRRLWLTLNHEACWDYAHSVKHGLVGVTVQKQEKERGITSQCSVIQNHRIYFEFFSGEKLWRPVLQGAIERSRVMREKDEGSGQAYLRRKVLSWNLMDTWESGLKWPASWTFWVEGTVRRYSKSCQWVI